MNLRKRCDPIKHGDQWREEPDAKIANELDGGRHLDNPEGYRRDRCIDVLLQLKKVAVSNTPCFCRIVTSRAKPAQLPG
jgi:hypothetical protein